MIVPLRIYAHRASPEHKVSGYQIYLNQAFLKALPPSWKIPEGQIYAEVTEGSHPQIIIRLEYA